jgi:Zn-dependent alcohol dehydrogenase
MLLPLHQKAIMGNLYGSISAYIDVPRLINIAMKEDLKLDKLITKKFQLEQINDVADAMVKRQVHGRWICVWD